MNRPIVNIKTIINHSATGLQFININSINANYLDRSFTSRIRLVLIERYILYTLLRIRSFNESEIDNSRKDRTFPSTF